MIEITNEIIDYVFNRKIPPKAFRNPAKAWDICKMRAKGYTYTDIGKTFNLSPSRVRVYVERTMRIYRAMKEKEKRGLEFNSNLAKALSAMQNWTEEQAIHDLEKVILRDERPAYDVVRMAIKALQKQTICSVQENCRTLFERGFMIQETANRKQEAGSRKQENFYHL